MIDTNPKLHTILYGIGVALLIFWPVNGLSNLGAQFVGVVFILAGFLQQIKNSWNDKHDLKIIAYAIFAAVLLIFLEILIFT